MSADEFDFRPVLCALADGDVDFVVIGGVAGGVYGSCLPAWDLDVAYASDDQNVLKLSEAIAKVTGNARRRPALEAGGNFTFDTTVGRLDVLAYAAGAPAYAELKRAATMHDIDGYPIRFASLDHLIAMKEAAGRPKDKAAAMEYRQISDELRAPRP